MGRGISASAGRAADETAKSALQAMLQEVPTADMKGLYAVVQAFKTTLESLGVGSGDVAVLPGGWRHDGGGHAVLYCVEAVTTEFFEFTICNTGEGLDAHPSMADPNSFKIKRKTAYTLPRIPRKRLLNVTTLMYLVCGYPNPPPPPSPPVSSHSAHPFYQVKLRGVISHDNTPEFFVSRGGGPFIGGHHR